MIRSHSPILFVATARKPRCRPGGSGRTVGLRLRAPPHVVESVQSRSPGWEWETVCWNQDETVAATLACCPHLASPPPSHIPPPPVTDGSLRTCEICRVYKPDRAHHCSSCDRCSLKVRRVVVLILAPCAPPPPFSQRLIVVTCRPHFNTTLPSFVWPAHARPA